MAPSDPAVSAVTDSSLLAPTLMVATLFNKVLTSASVVVAVTVNVFSHIAPFCT